MQVYLTPEFEKYVKDRVDSGAYESSSQVVPEALRIMKLHEKKLQALKEDIKIGIDQADRGQVRSAEEVFDRLEERHARLTNKAK